MIYFLIHAFIHILLYVSWRYTLRAQWMRLLTVDHKLTVRGQIKQVFLMGAIPYTLGAALIALLPIIPPFDTARFIVTFSYLIHCRFYLSYLRGEGIEIEVPGKKKTGK